MTATCQSRGPRIGEEGQPICHLPKYHTEIHWADPEDGWGDHMKWSDVSLCGYTNMDNRPPAAVLDKPVPEA